MPFNLSIDDFRTLAQAALDDKTCDFEKSKAADRVRHVFQNRNFGPSQTNDSLELRQNLASAINELYRRGERIVIPRAVAEALKVDKMASGFKLQRDGSLVATNHPLTDRRLVAIMTAINLNDEHALGATCEQLDRDLAAFLPGNGHSPTYNLFWVSAKDPFSKLTTTIRQAGEQKVKPATLKRFMRTLRHELNVVKDSFQAAESQLGEEERATLRDLVTRALDLGNKFGAQVDQLPALPPVAPLPVADPDNLEVQDVLEANLVANPSPEQILANHRSLVLSKITEKLGAAANDLQLAIGNLVSFSPEEEELLRGAGDEVDRLIEEKATKIANAVNRLAEADLEPEQKVAFITRVVPQDGAIDKAEFDAAVLLCRTHKFEALAAEKKAAFEGDVAKKVLESITADPDCKVGLANLNADFPMLKSFKHHVKADHKNAEGQPDPLAKYDLTQEGVLKDLLAGKLEEAKKGFDPPFDVGQELNVFADGFETLAKTTAAAIGEKLQTVLKASVFEDDRTILMKLALDPAKAETFEKTLADAEKRYDDSVFDRMVVSMMGNKAEAAKLKPLAKEAPSKVSGAFRDVMGFEGEKPQYRLPPTEAQVMRERRLATGLVIGSLPGKDDLTVGLGTERAALGNEMRQGVRTLFADLFTPKAKTLEGLREIFTTHAAALQALLLDPALMETTAVPGDRNGGDAVRQLLRQFLADIGDSVNEGQLTPADFKDALASALKEKAVETFAAGLAAAGRAVLKNLQGQLTAQLTDVLRKMANTTGELPLSEKTLAELGASGLSSLDAGYGKFLANVLDNYFTDESLEADHDRMLESLMRYGKTGGTVGDALSALIKGAGPVFQKILQSIPLEGLPEEIVKALMDVKSSLAPIPPKDVRARLDAAIANNNAQAGRDKIASIEVKQSLGAASVGQALLCTVTYADPAKKPEDVVIKLLRPGIKEIVLRERVFFNKMAYLVDDAMAATFGARMAGIMDELDFTKEANWITTGQCYGKASNYVKTDKPANGDDDSYEVEALGGGLNFGTMDKSGALPVQTDLLALKVVEGKPLDRVNKEARTRLDHLTRRLARQVPDEKKGGTRLAYHATNSLDYMEIRTELTDMYKLASNRRKLLGELLRRFSSELFWRNYDGKGQGGGFMHGDLHAGNLLVGKKSMTVIDFGNSFAFSPDDRAQLVAFVAACGFADAGLALEKIAPQLSKRADYDAIEKDVKKILSKGDANDVIARGMAVVQYLQRKNVTVPGAIMNFTETVMRLATACDETEALMNDIAGTIDNMAVDPAVRTTDMLAGNIEEVFFTKRGAKLRNSLVGKFNAISLSLGQLGTNHHVVTPEEFREQVRPMIALLRNSEHKTEVYGLGNVVIRDEVRRIERELDLLGDKVFATKTDGKGKTVLAYPRVEELLFRLYVLSSAAAQKFSDAIDQAKEWHPEKPVSVNGSLQAGLTQLGKTKLATIVGFHSAGMVMHGKAVMGKASLTQARRQMATDAQRFYQQRNGLLEVKTRRFVDRQVADRFLWTPGTSEEALAGKWHKTPKSVDAVVNTLKVNLQKLHNALEVGGYGKGTAEIDNYALIAFALPTGLVDALQALSADDYKALRATVAAKEPAIAEKLDFLRTDPSLREAVAVGKCTAEASEYGAYDYNVLLSDYAQLQSNFLPLKGPFEFTGNAFQVLVGKVKEQYAAACKVLFGEEKVSNWYEAQLDYALMRYWLDSGFLQALAAQPNRDTLVNAFGEKGFFASSPVKDLLKRLLGYMK